MLGALRSGRVYTHSSHSLSTARWLHTSKSHRPSPTTIARPAKRRLVEPSPLTRNYAWGKRPRRRRAGENIPAAIVLGTIIIYSLNPLSEETGKWRKRHNAGDF